VWDKKLPGGLEVLEDVGDFLAGFLGVVDGDVLALFSADRGISANRLAGVHGGMLGNFEGLLCAIGGFHGDRLRALADIVDSALGRMDRFVAEPLDGMGGLGRAFAGRVDDDVPSLPARSAPLAASLRPWTAVFSVNLTVSTVPSAVFTAMIFAPASTFSTVPETTWVTSCARATATAKQAARSTRATRSGV